ncbi:MAG: glycosyltransferase [Clostridiales bacterium]|nr:glycosyltransferase [Clostridiales bacterium]
MEKNKKTVKKVDASKTISVIVPVYKVERFLDRCVESLVGQTYKDLEIILVDDGSPDNSGRLCDEWVKKDNRIKVIHKANAGVSEARNSGLEIATGEFIAFLDSDDYLEPTAYEVAMSKMTEDCDAVIFGFNQVGSETDISKHYLSDNIYDSANIENFVREACLNGLFNFVGIKIYRSSVCKGIRFRKGLQFGEDFLYNAEVIKKCKKIVTLSDCLHNYIIYQNETSLSKIAKIDLVVSTYKLEHETLVDWFGKSVWLNSRYVYRFFICMRNYVKNSDVSKEDKLKLISTLFDSEDMKEALANCQMTGLKRKIAKFIVSRKNQKFRYLLLKMI